MKEVQQSSGGKNLNLFIYERLKAGMSPHQISVTFGIKKPRLSYYLATLKRAGMIKKLGYGTWEVVKDFDQKEVQQSTRVAKHTRKLNLLQPDTVRGHAFVFRYELPADLRNWDKREEILKQLQIPYVPLRIFGGGQKIVFKGRKVWLTDKSIIIYEPESFIAPIAQESQSKALYHMLELLRGLERLLKANLSLHKSRFKVSRQHYALIKNALAKQYNEEGKKLECFYPGEGLWFLIDNSFNLNEAETVNPKSAVPDNKKVQDFFNGIKKYEGFTPSFLMESIGGVTANQELYARNIESHIQAIQDLGSGVKELVALVKEMKK